MSLNNREFLIRKEREGLEREGLAGGQVGRQFSRQAYLMLG
jgi:hypothetical protein